MRKEKKVYLYVHFLQNIRKFRIFNIMLEVPQKHVLEKHLLTRGENKGAMLLILVFNCLFQKDFKEAV
jgi:hypothetical protein